MHGAIDAFVLGQRQRRTANWPTARGLNGAGPPSGPCQGGPPRVVSRRAVAGTGSACQLRTLGVSPRDAFRAATVFTDFGTAPTSNEFGLSRMAGNIFPDGYDTILLWRKGEGARVMPTDEGGFVNINQFICAPFGGESGPVVLVRVEDVVESVMAVLLPDGVLPADR